MRIDLTVNSLSLLLQVFGTGRLISRFGAATGLLANPVIMVVASLAIVVTPVLFVLSSIQVLRRVAEYAIAKPTREMLFTVVDQESRYKAKNIIDTVVYRFWDMSAAWVGSLILPTASAGLPSSVSSSRRSGSRSPGDLGAGTRPHAVARWSLGNRRRREHEMSFRSRVDTSAQEHCYEMGNTKSD
jgi:hypothetical protein